MSMPVPAPEFVERNLSTTLFIVDPYVPTGGVIFLHGRTSLGKSPLSWELARCVASGQSFFGLPTRQGTVLYLEVDTPAHQVQKRLKELPQPLSGRWFLEFGQPFNVLFPGGRMLERLRACQEELTPDLVVINTLRKVHYADDKESNVPVRVYGAFQALFPQAALWFNHHDKKTGDPTVPRNPDEEFSGTQAWLNDATVGLHLMKSGPAKGVIRLDHTKSQVSDLRKPLVLQLEDDGSNITPFAKGRRQRVMTVFLALDEALPKMERYRVTAQALGLGESTVRKWVEEPPEHGQEQ